MKDRAFSAMIVFSLGESPSSHCTPPLLRPPSCHRDPLIASDSDTRAFKTMIVFSLGEGPGQLFKALAVFALRDLDLLKVSGWTGLAGQLFVVVLASL